MKRFPKILLIAAASVAGLGIVLILAGLIVVQTGWFRSFVRQKIAAAAEESTGARTEIGDFKFSPFQLRAEVDNLVLHGTEGPNEPPLLRARSVVVGLKIVSLLHRDMNISLLMIDQPQAYVEIKPDGTTNIPAPKVKTSSKKDPIQTVMDLAVGHFSIRKGLLRFADKKTPLNVEGDNLLARMQYDSAVPRYTGDISMTPVYVQSGGRRRLPVNTNVAFTIQRNRIEVTSARFDAPQSNVRVAATMTDLSNLRGSLTANGRLSLPELAGTAGLALSAPERQAPPLDVAVSIGLNGNTLDLLRLQLAEGRSRLEASGAITDLNNLVGSIGFDGRLVLGELGRILGVSLRPEGTVGLGGNVRLAGAGNYVVSTKIDARDVSLQSGATRLAGINGSADVSAGPRVIAAKDIRVAALGGAFAGNAEVASMDRFRFDGTVNNFDTRYLARRYASRNLVWDGIISGPIHAAGRLKAKQVARSVVATAHIGIRPGPNGVPLSGLIDVTYDGPANAVNLGNSFIQLPQTRLNLSGSIGNQLRIGLVSRNLNDLLPAIAMASSNPPRSLPVALAQGGVAGFDGTVTGSLADPRIAGHIAVTNFVANGQQYDRFAADLDARTSAAGVRNVVLAGRGLDARLDASVGLRDWKPGDTEPVTANVSIKGTNVHDLLAAAGSAGTPLSGAVIADAHVTGTVGDPRGTAHLAITNGVVSDEPFSRMAAQVNYAGRSIQLTNGEVATPAGRIGLNANFQHPPGQFHTGRIQFELTSSPIQLQQLVTVRARQPGLQGTLNLKANGAVDLMPAAANRARFQVAALNANLGLHGIEIDKKRAGDLTLAANTTGQNLVFKLDSDLADSGIHGNGTVRLAGDYPVTATIAFKPIRFAPVMRLVSTRAQANPQIWDGAVEGTLTVAGPAMRPADLKGSLQLATLQVTACPQAAGPQGARKPIAIRNAGPILITLEKQVVRIQNARLVGPSTKVAFGGTINLGLARTMDVRVDGNIGLDLAQTFDPNIYSSGNIVIAAAVKGSPSKPGIDGRLQLVNANVNYLDAPNGLSNGNGVILFNGNQAVVQSLTGETGGGKVSVSGLVRYGGPQMDFRLRAAARGVRVRSEGISVLVNAGLDFAGSTGNSVLSGDVTVLEVAMHSHTDLGSVLSQGGAPANTPTKQSGFLAGLRLDIRIDTSPGIQFVTPLTQNLQAEAHVRLRGSAASPGMLGRAVISQGEIMFFGSRYTVDQGTIDFYNPIRIQPVLNISLTAQAKGVNVTLSVSGPIDNLKLTYHSDPPLQFSDIVALLATGKTPTSDPVLAAGQPPAPEQSWEQMGASAVLSQGVANPVSGRLQRLFGVTRLKIDPQIIGVENTPKARVTLEQQVTREIFFTYIQDVRSSNPQVIRVEWAIDPTWSAVALRQDNGQLGVDFFYKKRFR